MTTPAPFWEQQRGGGPVTRLMRRYDEARKKDAALARRRANPDRYVRVEGWKPRRSDGGRMSYQESRRRGLCSDCGRKTDEAARCDSCAEKVNGRRKPDERRGRR